ncbi:MAG: hypothetical protein Q4D42_02095 [Eubacteriales bacterium]|nr:hypothetical protein [Eubacteriales bacterium]
MSNEISCKNTVKNIRLPPRKLGGIRKNMSENTLKVVCLGFCKNLCKKHKCGMICCKNALFYGKHRLCTQKEDMVNQKEWGKKSRKWGFRKKL